MLQTLRVRNLALVENATVDFEPGLNIVTGETGAGKSLLLGALSLLVGERADKTAIRTGADQCLVEAAFHLPDPSAVDALLRELDLDTCDNGQLVIRRSILASGSGKSFVNDRPATAQVLKQLGEVLIDMHGPHDHQSLLSPASQMDILDSFGHLDAQSADYHAVYTQMRDLEQQRHALDGDDKQVAQQIELLQYQVKEIEDAKPVEGEDAEIEKQQTLVANAQRIVELADSIAQALSEGEASAFNGLSAAQQALANLAPLVPEAAGWRDEARGIAVSLQELSREVRSFVEKVDADPQRLQWLDDRMAQYHKLKRKYGATVSEILAFLAQIQKRLHDLETRGQRIAEIDVRLAEIRGKITDLGAKLGKKRRATARRLAEAITRELRDLGFEHGTFGVELRDSEPKETGTDDIEFTFAPNVGEPMQPLRAIASSGEISRVMLATKAVLADYDRIPVLVFDEIDANVGGKLGNAVGAKLAEVARKHQILCITHLPQVAACGRTHFAVTKDVVDSRTFTRIERLDGEKRAEELARMLGGRDLTSVTLKHAREMLRNLQAAKP